MFAVTSEGVILVDPTRAEAAEWLKGQISERFGQTVKTLSTAIIMAITRLVPRHTRTPLKKLLPTKMLQRASLRTTG